MISGHTPRLLHSLSLVTFCKFCFKGLPLAFIIDIGPPLAAIKKCGADCCSSFWAPLGKPRTTLIVPFISRPRKSHMHRPMQGMSLMLNERKTGSTYRQCTGATRSSQAYFVAFSIEETKPRTYQLRFRREVLIYNYSNLNIRTRCSLSLCISRDAIDLESISTPYSVIHLPSSGTFACPYSPPFNHASPLQFPYASLSKLLCATLISSLISSTSASLLT
jgi:hypothetical protein